MSSYIALSHRPSNRNKYSVIIPCAGPGKRLKTIGPKCLALVDNETILSRQLRIIYDCFNYHEIIVVGGYEINKLKSKLGDKIKLVVNKNYEDTNVLHSIHLGLQKVKTDKVVIIYGDLVFNKECLYLPFGCDSGLVIAGGMKEEEVGCIYKNGLVENVFFGLEEKWAQISYFTKNELEMLCVLAKDHPDWFGFEAINEIIIKNGILKAFLPKGGSCTDVDSSNDLKKINENFNKTQFISC